MLTETKTPVIPQSRSDPNSTQCRIH